MSLGLLLHFTANGCLIFNDTASGDPAVCAIAFGGDKTVTSGTLQFNFQQLLQDQLLFGIA